MIITSVPFAMIGGMITAPLLSLFIIPAAYKLMWLRRHRRLAAHAYRPSALTRLRYSPGVQPNSRTKAL
ncbi:AcrB/AcrD/AcrF family protein [Salmonella enterica]|nr:AcrB/AcrD/AcrF family protein [Salmonella enterica]